IKTSNTDPTSKTFSVRVSPSHRPSGTSTIARSTSCLNAASDSKALRSPLSELIEAAASLRRPVGFSSPMALAFHFSPASTISHLGSRLGPCVGDVELLGRTDVIQPAHRKRIWRPFYLRSVLLCLTQNRDHRSDECIELLFRLCFRRLDQQAFRHEQRKISRRRMKAEIQQPLGEVHRGDAELLRLAL